MERNEKLVQAAMRVLPGEGEEGQVVKVPITKGPEYFPDNELPDHVSKTCFVYFKRVGDNWEFQETTEE